MGARESSLPLPPAARTQALHRLRSLTSKRIERLVPTARRQIGHFEAGNHRSAPRAIPDPASYQQKATYALPFAGEWYVLRGGVDKETTHSWGVISQRYAYDFVMTDEAMRRWRTIGKEVEDYRCYGAPVLAPADGVVVEVREGVRDAPRPGTGWLDVLTPDFGGNHVVTRHAEDEYSYIAHLMPGSIVVVVGEWVEQGRQVGRCGNSGRSMEPHVHFHVQDRADMFDAVGLPVAFDGVSVGGGKPEPASYPVRGTRIRATNF